MAALLAAAFLLAAPLPGAAESLGLLLGGRTVTIPIPEGYTLLGREAGPWHEAAATLTARGNAQLAVFVPQKSLEALYRGMPPDFSRSLQVQIPLARQESEVGEAEFARLKARLRDQVEEQYAQSSGGSGTEDIPSLEDESAWAGLARRPAAGSGEESMPGGVILEEENALAFMTLQSVAPEDDPAARRTVAIGTCLLLARGRLLYLYAFALFEDETSLSWVRRTLRDWARQMIRANAP